MTDEESAKLIERQRHNEAAINALCDDLEEMRKIVGKLEWEVKVLMGRI